MSTIRGVARGAEIDTLAGMPTEENPFEVSHLISEGSVNSSRSGCFVQIVSLVATATGTLIGLVAGTFFFTNLAAGWNLFRDDLGRDGLTFLLVVAPFTGGFGGYCGSKLVWWFFDPGTSERDRN